MSQRQEPNQASLAMTRPTHPVLREQFYCVRCLTTMKSPGPLSTDQTGHWGMPNRRGAKRNQGSGRAAEGAGPAVMKLGSLDNHRRIRMMTAGEKRCKS